MYEICVQKPWDLGYFRGKNRNKTGEFDENQDALVLVFKLQNIGHVAVVVAPVFPNGYMASYAASAHDAKIIAARDVADMFECGRDCDSFELPWQMVLKHKNTNAHICLKTSKETAAELASEERNQDAAKEGSFHNLLPFEHYLWWNETLLEEYTVECVQLELKPLTETYSNSFREAMRVVDEAIIA